MTWIHFWDMSSGGFWKTPYHHIYIQAPEHLARIEFEKRFHRNPDNITCYCCGEDYAVMDEETDDLAQATGFERGCAVDGDIFIEKGNASENYTPYDQFLTDYTFANGEQALVIRSDELLHVTVPVVKTLWTSVKDKLPPTTQPVLIRDDAGRVGVAKWLDFENAWGSFTSSFDRYDIPRNPTHWLAVDTLLYWED